MLLAAWNVVGTYPGMSRANLWPVGRVRRHGEPIRAATRVPTDADSDYPGLQ